LWIEILEFRKIGLSIEKTASAIDETSAILNIQAESTEQVVLAIEEINDTSQQLAELAKEYG